MPKKLRKPKVRVTLYLAADQTKLLRRVSDAVGVSVSELVDFAISEKLQELGFTGEEAQPSEPAPDKSVIRERIEKDPELKKKLERGRHA